MEYQRKQAKALVRAYRAGEPDAARRVAAVLGERARERFLLSDAQHVIAREHGHRSWPAFVGTSPARDRLSVVRRELVEARERWGEVGETTLDARVEYADGDPVLVHLRKRGHRYKIDDGGGAVARAGRTPGWLDRARRVVEGEHWLNVSRSGLVFVQAVEGGRPGVAPLVLRVADASADLYEELLDLE
jgi:hypothetical protein